jgi:predicted nucleic acid-binding protein
VIVVDASVVVTALADDGPEGARVRDRLTGEALAAPSLLDLEVISAWRRLLKDDHRAAVAINDLHRIRIARASQID